jgi:hypothetical protein
MEKPTMNLGNLCGRGSLAFSLIFLSATLLIAQSEPRPEPAVERNYDVALHLIVGSNDGGGSEVPLALSPAVRQIRSSFNYSSYRLASTFVGRVANAGSFEYKSVGSIFGDKAETNPSPFLEWSLSGLRRAPEASGRQGLLANSFRFGARIPIAVGASATSPTYTYEAIGLNLARVGLAENVPTLIGTLNLPGARGVIFLVMTVRSADM